MNSTLVIVTAVGTAIDLPVRVTIAGAILTTGLVTGVVSLYAHTIMPGLRGTDDRTFVAAFQGIDRAIINPWFMSCFFAPLALIGVSVALTWGRAGAVTAWLIAALMLYLAAVVITVTIHVPRNDAMKAAGDVGGIPDLARTRADFDEARWARWNVVRTLACLVSLCCLLWANLLVPG